MSFIVFVEGDDYKDSKDNSNRSQVLPSITPSESGNSTMQTINMNNAGKRTKAIKAKLKSLKERGSKSMNRNHVKVNKQFKNMVLPYVHTGPLYWADLRKKRERERLPRDYYYKGTMGKIKENPIIYKIKMENDANSEFSDTLADLKDYGNYINLIPCYL